MTAQLAHIVRHPVKSVGYEELERASLQEGRTLAFDRIWAVAHEAAAFGAGQPEAWVSKRNFLRGVAGPELMAIRAQLDEATGRLTLAHPRAGEIALDLSAAADRLRLIDWLRPLWPADRPAASHVVTLAEGGALTDVPEPYVAVLNLGSLAALSERLGQPMSIHRFRGNLWIEGWKPFAELALPGRRFRIGAALLEGAERITRCRATCANPDTGIEDADTLAALNAGWGHQDFGLYARVIEGGAIARGDAVELVA